jgi:hypothetical protein
MNFQQSHVILQPTKVQHKIGASKISSYLGYGNVTFNSVTSVLNSAKVSMLFQVKNTVTYKYCDAM